MSIQFLEIHNFRNLKHQKIFLNKRLNLVIGDNAQGKTNFLETIHFALSGQGLKGSDYRESIQFSAEQATINSKINKNKLEYSVKIKLGREKKEIYLNEKHTIAKKISSIFPFVLFCPESLSSIKGSPAQRRQLMDHALFHNLEYRNLSSQYERLLKARNKVLKDLRENPTSELLNVYTALTEQMVPIGAQVTFLRMQLLRNLEKIIEPTLQKIMGEESICVKVEYLISEVASSFATLEETNDALRLKAESLSKIELSVGNTLFGPHKHDLRFLVNEKEAKAYCSQGQQRALILAFKISQIVHHFESYGSFPLLLLDDVLSELDEDKRLYLVAFLKSLNTQTILTSAEKLSSLSKLGFDLKDEKNLALKVENGIVSKIERIESINQGMMFV